VTYDYAARAIYELGRDRLGELFEIAMPPMLVARILLWAKDKVFRGLSDASISQLLQSGEYSVRKKCSAKICNQFTESSPTTNAIKVYDI